jgi:broad specificity phosphatase PhoE
VRERLHRIATIVLTTGSFRAIPGSEPSAALRGRALAVIARIAARYPGGRVATVSHGALINAFFAAMLGIERDYFFPCANTAISIVRVNGDRRLLLALNDVAHLRQAGLMS